MNWGDFITGVIAGFGVAGCVFGWLYRKDTDELRKLSDRVNALMETERKRRGIVAEPTA